MIFKNLWLFRAGEAHYIAVEVYIRPRGRDDLGHCIFLFYGYHRASSILWTLYACVVSIDPLSSEH